MRNPFARRHPIGEEELSAYLDGRLSPAASARLERHLTSCGPCRRHLKELRAVVEGLRALPSAPAPRSFTLRPEQSQAHRPVGAAWLPRASAFGPAGAAVVTLVLFIVLVGVDLGTIGGGGAPEGAVPASLAKEAMQADQAYGGASSTTSPGEAQGFEEPSMQAAPAPAPTPAPELAPSTDADGREAAGTPEPTAGAATPTETPAAIAAPAPPATEGGDDTGRWVLRGFQGLAGAAFLASVALLWRRRRAGRI